MDKCYNTDCEDHDEEAENGCYFSDFPDTCIGFVSEEKWKTKMKELGLLLEGVTMEDNKKGGGLPPNYDGASRMSARSVLQDKIQRQERVLDSLRVLEASIRWESLSKKQEEFLWHYFSMSR